MMKKLWQNRLALIMTIAMGFVSILPIVALAQANTYDMDEMNDGLEEEGVLRVGMEANYAPFNWSQTTNSDGPLKSVIRLANMRMGMMCKLRFVWRKNWDWR